MLTIHHDKLPMKVEQILSRIMLFLTTLCLMSTIAQAQPTAAEILAGKGPATGETGSSDKTVIEGIAAVVGDRIILLSDVFQRAALLRESAQRVGLTQDQLLKEVLNELIYTNLLLVKAEEDSVTVSDDLVEAQAEQYVDRLIRQAGSEMALEMAVGKSMLEIQSEARSIVREQLLVQILQQRRFADLKVTERDLDEFYRLYKDSLPDIPEHVEIAHIYIAEEPSEEVRRNTVELAASIIDSIRNGGDFVEFVRRYSTDPGSAVQGGELGWSKRGKFVPEYEEAAWKLGINEISPPTESKFGLHIIQLLDKRNDEMRTRHILIPLEAGEKERQALLDRLNSIRERALGGESFAALAGEYSQDEESKFQGGLLAKAPTTQMGAYSWILDSLEIGEITEPRPFAISPTESGYHIIKLVRVIPPHSLDPVEDRELLEQQAKNWKQQNELLAWIEELQEEIYWEVKDRFGK
ncbi:MAG: peptidylprolyl isomerase [Chlorobi bacterium]|nr:peptidylprolyl isomerase [Chlorobiota bacterium]